MLHGECTDCPHVSKCRWNHGSVSSASECTSLVCLTLILLLLLRWRSGGGFGLLLLTSSFVVISRSRWSISFSVISRHIRHLNGWCEDDEWETCQHCQSYLPTSRKCESKAYVVVYSIQNQSWLWGSIVIYISSFHVPMTKQNNAWINFARLSPKALLMQRHSSASLVDRVPVLFASWS